MTRDHIISEIKRKKSFLCIGLDSDISKIPEFLLQKYDPVFEFNKQIINNTHDLCIAYKPNTAFYECNGTKGWKSLEKTIQYIKTNHPEIFIIADAKRGDIGNTSKMYAKAFFENMSADAVTVAPYMGSDSVLPFLEYKNKWVVLLALTSNSGAKDFQYFANSEANPLFREVLSKSKNWADENQIMFVVGATKADMLAEIRKITPNHFLLIPGVGAQGGSLKEVINNGMNKDCGLIVNASRSIIFTGNTTEDFGLSSRKKAEEIQQEMQKYLLEYKIITL